MEKRTATKESKRKETNKNSEETREEEPKKKPDLDINIIKQRSTPTATDRITSKGLDPGNEFLCVYGHIEVG